nr:hypothetical protein [Tanacetum cinerariifolium]
MNQNYFEPNPCYNSNSSDFDQFQPPQYLIVHQPPQETNTEILHARENLMEAIQVFLKKYDQIPSEEKCIALFLDGDDNDDDYDKESIISMNTDIFEIPLSDVITTSPPILLIEDPEDSLIMGNGELYTISEKESDEFINSSVEDLIPIPSESEDTSGMTYPLFDEVLENIESKDSYDSNFDEPDLLVTPLSDANKDECFDSGGDVDKFNDFKDGYYDSEGDILYLESLLNDDLVHHDPSIPKMSVASILEGFTDEPPLEENDTLFDLEPKNDDWNNILYDAPILMTEDKVFDPWIHDQIFSSTYVSLPFTDRHYLFFTYVVRIFLPHITYPVVSLFLISYGSEDTIFDPDISAFHFSHQSGTFISFDAYPNILNESPMKICSSTRFYLNITMI